MAKNKYDDLVNEYIQHKYTNKEFVSKQGLILFLINSKYKGLTISLSDAQAVAREYKGLLHTYAVEYLKDKISKGRNSQQLTTFLNQIQKEYEDDIEVVDTEQLNIVIQTSDKQTEGGDSE